jgi:hypothetical protein
MNREAERRNFGQRSLRKRLREFICEKILTRSPKRKWSMTDLSVLNKYILEKEGVFHMQLQCQYYMQSCSPFRLSNPVLVSSLYHCGEYSQVLP